MNLNHPKINVVNRILQISITFIMNLSCTYSNIIKYNLILKFKKYARVKYLTQVELRRLS